MNKKRILSGIAGFICGMAISRLADQDAIGGVIMLSVSLCLMYGLWKGAYDD